MEEYKIVPKVDETQEFLEIANDFSNPLEIVREGISNAFDADAKLLQIYFNTEDVFGDKQLVIQIIDDGCGMNREGLQSFFDLGNSLRRDNTDAIGEKGHGTKVYFNSKSIEVKTHQGNKTLTAKLDEPFNQLHNRVIPTVEVVETLNSKCSRGTEIIVRGYNKNRREKFTHSILKDYIMWFTKLGAVENIFDESKYKGIKLLLKGLDKKKFERIEFGHFFPENSLSVEKLFDEYLVKAPKYYCKRIIREGSLKNFPEIGYHAVISIEGNSIKYDYNEMLRRPGYKAPKGNYTVQERYGLWLCKDFIPIQQKNVWINRKGSENTRFHAFVNCQDLKLTANRGSVDNTPYDILEDLKKEVEEMFEEIYSSNDWVDIEWLSNEVSAYNTIQKEKKEFDKRVDKINKSNITEYKGHEFVEPKRESGVYALVLQMQMLEPDIFPFKILDYDTYSGIDVIVKGNDNLLLKQSKMFYVEFKNYLINDFNHSFENLHSIICWDTEVKNNQRVEDIDNKVRTMQIIEPEDENDYTRYFLEDRRDFHKIEIFVLKDYLKQKYNMEFRPRTEKTVHKK